MAHLLQIICLSTIRCYDNVIVLLHFKCLFYFHFDNNNKINFKKVVIEYKIVTLHDSNK